MHAIEGDSFVAYHELCKAMKTCGAKTRSGTPCQKAPVKGRNRCHLHGGKSLRGADHPGYKTGLYSKYAGKSLQKIMDELAGKTGDDLISPEPEIRLMEALILASKALKNDVTRLDDLELLSRTIDRLIMAKQRSQKVLLEQNRLIPSDDVKLFMSYIEDVLHRHVDSDKAQKILSEIQTFRISEHAN